MRAVIRDTGKELANDLTVADSLFARMKGLLGVTFLAPGEGIWLRPCKAVHTFGMRFAIDVVVLDRNRSVLAVINGLKPNRATAIYRRASTVLELPAHSAVAAGLSPGDIIEMIA